MPSELRTERRGSTLVLTMSDPATANTLSEQLFTAGDVERFDTGREQLLRQRVAGGRVAHRQHQRAATAFGSQL